MMSLRNMVHGLENDSPAKQLIQYWDHDAQTLKFWRASSNFVYCFDSFGVRHYLRFIHAKDKPIADIQVELDFMLYLLEQGYPTVAPVRSRRGSWIETVSIETDVYYGVVFEQASGQHIPLDQMTEVHINEWGKALASLHQLSEAYSLETAPQKDWHHAVDFVSNVLQRYPQETVLRQELDRLRNQLSELPTGKGHTGYIHYDFETDNIFFDMEKSQYFIIDFDDGMVHWFMMDITSAIHDLFEQDNEENRRMLQQFLAGYRSIKAIDEGYVSLLSVFQKFEDLYTFARLLRSVEDMEIASSPDWAIKLKDKLLGECDRIRERYRPLVELRSDIISLL
jgi:Ser/Thr protein kinase RdoA (MazF antagonist)